MPQIIIGSRLLLRMSLDRLRLLFCNGRGNVRLSADVILPIGMVPGMILVAASGPLWTVLAFTAVPLFGLHISRKFKTKNPRTPVFSVWALCTFIFLLAVMELEVIPFMEIYIWENLLLKSFVGILLFCVYEMRKGAGETDAKSTNNQQALLDPEMAKKCSVCNQVQTCRSSHCRCCGICIVQRDHHCFWIDTCIGARNHRIFLLGLVFLICANYYGAMLTLTTVCQPILIMDFLLVPTDCSGVYDDVHLAVCFVSAIYSVLITVMSIATLLKQMFLISINVTLEEWRMSRSVYNGGVDSNSIRKLHSNGIISNWCLFLRGQR